MREATKDWLVFVNLDIKAARLIIEDASLSAVAIFHAHQAIEKGLKALLEEKQIPIPRSHNLEKLHASVQTHWKLEMDEDTLALLNTFYIDARYPADLGLLPSGYPSHTEAEQFVSFAEEFHRQLCQLLQGPAGEER